jgi:hypothetical protein
MQTLPVSGTGRYIRMYGTARATPYGYSLWEFGVYTTGSGSPPPPLPGNGALPASFWGDTSTIPAAALNRHVAQLPVSQQSSPSQFYLAAPANYYAQFWHQNAINNLAYGFPYDDYAGQSSDISVTNPQYLIVAVGW